MALAIAEARAWGWRVSVSANNVLDHVKGLVNVREENYGDFHVTSYRTAAIQGIVREEVRKPEDFCLDMVAVKLARIYSNPSHLDNYYDAIAYLAEAAALLQTPREEY